MLTFVQCDGTFPLVKTSLEQQRHCRSDLRCRLLQEYGGIPSWQEAVMFSMRGWWLSHRSGSGVVLDKSRLGRQTYITHKRYYDIVCQERANWLSQFLKHKNAQ